jgi:hypothetical protein
MVWGGFFQTYKPEGPVTQEKLMTCSLLQIRNMVNAEHSCRRISLHHSKGHKIMWPVDDGFRNNYHLKILITPYSQKLSLELDTCWSRTSVLDQNNADHAGAAGRQRKMSLRSLDDFCWLPLANRYEHRIQCFQDDAISCRLPSTDDGVTWIEVRISIRQLLYECYNSKVL